MSPLRLFIGVPVAGEAHDRLRAALADLAQVAPRARHSPPGNLHLTLRFLGATDAALVPDLGAALKQELAGARPFSLEVAGVRGFGPPRRPRVLFADLQQGRDRLSDLAARIDRALDSLALPPRDRPFEAHLTLARSRDRRGDSALAEALEALRARPFGPLSVQEVVLYESTLTPEGSRYTPRIRIPLLESPPP